jgi:WD40 repeat protein
MSWHHTLWNVTDSLILRFLRFINILILFEKLAEHSLPLFLCLRRNKYIICAILILRRGGSSSDSNYLRFLLRSLFSLFESINFVEGGSDRVCDLWGRRRTSKEIRGYKTWLFCLCLSKHWDLSCSNETSILGLRIWNLNNSLRIHLRRSDNLLPLVLLLLTRFTSLCISWSVDHFNILAFLISFYFRCLRYRSQLIRIFLHHFCKSLLRSLKHHLLRK